MKLLNWREDKGHVEMIIDHYNLPKANRARVLSGEIARACMKPQVISFKELQYNPDNNTEYLHDDTLCFRVSKVIICTGNEYYITLHKCIHIDPL